MMKKYILLILFFTLSLFMFSCAKKEGIKKEIQKQLNITILLDLSDRIDPKVDNVNPSHSQRDIEIVEFITEIFKSEMKHLGTVSCNGKIKIIFIPQPQDENINSIAKDLNIDLSVKNIKEKKEIYETITDKFSTSLNKIYSDTLKTKKWLGSDIWRFFKNDVKDYAIDDKYRNILVILTDGYIYHKDSINRENNRYAYILPKLFEEYKLRKNSRWQEILEKQNFGLITKRNDLKNLEILVLEITPSSKNKDDEDIIKYILSKWFEEMGVKKYSIYNTDLPEYTKKRIKDFLL